MSMLLPPQARGKVAVKGKGEMLTYTLVRHMEDGDDTTADTHLATQSDQEVDVSHMSAEALLSSPQYKKAMERCEVARAALAAEVS